MGAYFPGRSVSLGSYPFFGVPVYAAADGTVVEASDGMDEQVPGGALKGVTVDTLPGKSHRGRHGERELCTVRTI